MLSIKEMRCRSFIKKYFSSSLPGLGGVQGGEALKL